MSLTGLKKSKGPVDCPEKGEGGGHSSGGGGGRQGLGVYGEGSL